MSSQTQQLNTTPTPLGKFKYTPEVTDNLITMHNDAMSPEDIAEALGTTKRSVIAKLSSLGLYRKPTYTNKNGEPPIKKDQYVDQLCELIDIDPELGESLGKVNKFILKKLIDVLGNTKASRSD